MYLLRHIIAPVLALGCVCASGAEKWSLDSCVSYAIEHNLSVRSAVIDNMNTELGVTEAKDRFLPTLSAGAQQSWDFGRSLTSDNTYANRNTSVFGWNVQLSLPLFQGLSAVRQLRQARAAQRAGRLQTEAIKDEVTLMVMSYYLQALYNRELLAVSREQLRLSRTQLERQEVLLEAGKVPEVDVIQARAQVASAEADTVNSANTLRLSLLDLAQALELRDPEGFDILPLPEGEETPRLMPLAEVTGNAMGSYPSPRVRRSQPPTRPSRWPSRATCRNSRSMPDSPTAITACRDSATTHSRARCAITSARASDSACAYPSSMPSRPATTSTAPR